MANKKTIKKSSTTKSKRSNITPPKKSNISYTTKNNEKYKKNIKPNTKKKIKPKKITIGILGLSFLIIIICFILGLRFKKIIKYGFLIFIIDLIYLIAR